MKTHRLLKTALIFLLSIGCAALAHAADPVVVVNSATSVSIDGKDSGKVADCIANHPQLASAIQRALEAWDTARSAAIKRATADAETKATAALNVIRKQKAEQEQSGKGKPYTGTIERLPNNPALIAALAGNKVYRTRHLLLAGDHVIETSSGSKYQHAQSQSWKDFLQTLGVAYAGWTAASIQKAKEITAQLQMHEITQQQAQQQMFQLQQAELAAQGAATSEAIGAGAEIAPITITPP